MSNNENGNGNGEDPHDSATPLDEVRRRIAQRQEEEASVGVSTVALGETDSPQSLESDPLHAWKNRDPGEPVSFEQIHTGLIAISQISEAAIEGGLKMSADLSKALPVIQMTASRVATIAAKVETNASHLGQVDDELAKTNKMLNGMRLDVQSLKDDMREVAEASAKASLQLPVIKEMLGEILARLPEPTAK